MKIFKAKTVVCELKLKAEMQAWRKKGPLGKLHNINIWIHRTEQRLQTFLKYSKNRRIPRDNKTRWNSWQRQIDKAINEEIMEAIGPVS
jgi:hypothetical protein